MEVGFMLRAFKCAACRLPVSGAGRWSSTVRQMSTLLLRPSTTLNSATPPPSASQTSPSAPLHTGPPLLSPFANSAVGRAEPANGAIACPLLKPAPVLNPSPLLPAAVPMAAQTRGRAQVYYRPSAWKRVNKHGLEKRLSTPGGIEILWRRKLKKRHSLTPFDRILPGTYNAQILPKHHLKYNQHLVSREVRRKLNEALGKKK